MIVQGHVQAVLPDYDVGPELGQGGFGRVFAGRHRRLDRPVAIKALALPAADALAAAGVDTEAQIIARLDHPHIVRVFDYVRTAEMAFIVMELLPGGTLAERVRAGLPPPAACAVVAAVAVALDRVHSAGLLHRDIKPSNVLFAADGAPRLTDFGIARMLEATGGVALTSVVGSTPYLAPEQFDLAVAGVGVDVYSLGAVLYELLAGEPPFGVDPRPHVMAERHRRARPRPLPAQAAAFGPLVACALAKEPAQRQPGALAFAEEVLGAAGRAFGPGWLAGTGVGFRGDDDLRRSGRASTPGPGSPWGAAARDTISLASPCPPDEAGNPAGPARTPTARPGRDREAPGPARWTSRFALPGTLSLTRWRERVPPAASTGPAGISAAALVAVIVTVVALLATGVLRVGPGDSVSAVPAKAPAAPPVVYPVSSPVPLRGLISLAADDDATATAGTGIYLTDSSQHSLIRFTGTAASLVVGRAGEDGAGRPGAARDEPAAVAGLRRPAGVAADGGSVFVADEWNCAVRRIYGPPGQSWRVETVAGRPVEHVAAAPSDASSGQSGDAGTGGLSVAADVLCPRGTTGGAKSLGAQIGTPSAVAVSPTGVLYFTTGYAGQVWRIDPAAGSGAYRSTAATLVAGNGATAGRQPETRERRYNGVDATRVPLENTYGIAVDGAGRVFVLSYGDGYARIHLVDNGTITTVVQRPLADAALTALAPAPGGRGVLFTDARSRTVWQIAAGPGAAAGTPTRVLGGTCVGDTERLFGVTADRAGDLYYSCNDATQASVYRVTARALAAGTTGPGQRVLY